VSHKRKKIGVRKRYLPIYEVIIYAEVILRSLTFILGNQPIRRSNRKVILRNSRGHIFLLLVGECTGESKGERFPQTNSDHFQYVVIMRYMFLTDSRDCSCCHVWPSVFTTNW